MSVFIEAMRAVCDDLARFDPNAPSLHFARGLMAAGVRPAGVRRRGPAPRYVEHYPAMVEAYKAGQSLLEVSKQFDCSVTVVSAALNQAGIEKRLKGPRGIGAIKDQARLDTIRQMVASGETLAKIGMHLGISRERVRQICARHKIEYTVVFRPLSAEKQAAVDAYLAGDSLVSAAEKAGMSDGGFRSLLIRYGHTVRPKARKGHSPKIIAKAERVSALYAQGVPNREIAQAVGLSKPEMIYSLLAIAGVAPNRIHRNTPQAAA